MTFKKIATSLLTFSAVLLAACGNGASTESQASTQSTEPVTVKLGVVSDNEAVIWEDVGKRLEDENITLEIVRFTDYNRPNEALNDGDIDLNAFQHVAFLNDFNSNNSADLVPIGFTYISPLGIYSEKIESVDDLKDGDTIAIPNDVTNGGRALYFLEALGILTLKDVENGSPAVSDIESYAKDITIQELDASQTARSLPDVTAAIINTNFAVDAGLTPGEDALQLDTDDLSKVKADYKNVVATKKENETNETFLKVVKEYQTDETAKLIVEASNGADTSAW